MAAEHRGLRLPATPAAPNAGAIEAWDTVLFDKFVRFRHLLTAGLDVHGDATLDRLDPGPGARVIDLGCGFGDSTRRIAGRVGASGHATGVDAARRFVEEAQRAHGDVPNARFHVADVQSDPLPGAPHDHAYGRFGTMFFASPVAALRNVRRALRDGGRLAMVVWRRREDNPWVHVAEQVARRLVDAPEAPEAVTCGPGPFSMAGADTVSAQLLAAGFDRVALERHDAPIGIGRDLDEAVAFATALGPAGELLRLAGDRADAVRPQLLAALREALAAFETPGGVLAPSSTWIVTARAA